MVWHHPMCYYKRGNYKGGGWVYQDLCEGYSGLLKKLLLFSMGKDMFDENIERHQ